jgi:hypothetical protein
MSSLLNFLAAQSAGISVLLLVLVVVVALTHWVLWMFGWGRFKLSSRVPGGVLSELLTKIIYEFRHLLALVVVLLFTVALFVAISPGIAKQDIEIIKDGLQAVAASLGGLIGSIIGYYFGESAASRGRLTNDIGPPRPAEPAVPEPPPGAGLRIPPKPRSGEPNDSGKP